jgi:hypothetical protein
VYILEFAKQTGNVFVSENLCKQSAWVRTEVRSEARGDGAHEHKREQPESLRHHLLELSFMRCGGVFSRDSLMTYPIAITISEFSYIVIQNT